MSKKVTPFLWFNGNAEEAANYYVSVFKNAELLGVHRAGEGGPVTTASFRLHDQEFVALNGGPQFAFTEAVSFVIDCADQAEVDYYWDTLTTGGAPSQCGWLKDRFCLSWQVVPKILIELLQDEDRGKANRVMQAMLQMTKIEIPKLQAAAAG